MNEGKEYNYTKEHKKEVLVLNESSYHQLIPGIGKRLEQVFGCKVYTQNKNLDSFFREWEVSGWYHLDTAGVQNEIGALNMPVLAITDKVLALKIREFCYELPCGFAMEDKVCSISLASIDKNITEMPISLSYVAEFVAVHEVGHLVINPAHHRPAKYVTPGSLEVESGAHCPNPDCLMQGQGDFIERLIQKKKLGFSEDFWLCRPCKLAIKPGFNDYYFR